MSIPLYTSMDTNIFDKTPRDANETTTIKITKETKTRLDHLRLYRRETYEEIMQKVLELLNLCRIAPERARLRLLTLDKQKRQNEKSKGDTHKKVLSSQLP